MKKTAAIAILSLAGASSFAALPEVSSVEMAQDSGTRVVSVSYTLSGAPAIITLDVLTNGVSIGLENIVTVYGDANEKVLPGRRTIKWRPDRDWEGRLFEATAKVTAWPLNNPPDWIVASLCMASNVQYYASAEQIPWGATNDIYKTRKILMRRIHAAGVPWNMGAPSCEPHINRDGTRETIHTVVLTNDFYIGVYEFTQSQYCFLMAGSRKTGSSGNYGGNTATTSWYKYPQNWLGWETLRGAAADYPWPGTRDVAPGSVLGVLRARTGLTLDLPLDAQWEFAARGGCPYAFYNGYNMRPTSDSTADDTDAHFDEIGWFTGNSSATTHPVGEKLPNAYGLYDMLGNLSEACLDKYQNNPTGYDPNIGLDSSSVSVRNRRGGSAVQYKLHQCRAAYRDAIVSDTTGRVDAGLRLCWTLDK